jgi:hypothetical protein
MLNGVGYGFYDETLSETNVSQIKIKPPLISYIYRKSDGYIKNFWHYYSDTKYSINVNKKIKSVFFSHKDFEVERSVSRLVIKEFAKSQEYHFLDKELIGSYLLSENKKGKYNIYIYKQDLNLRFFLFDKNSDLEIMGDVLVDSGHLIFSNAKSNSGLNNIVIKADKSFTSIHLKVNDKHMVFDLSKKLKSDFEY